MIYHPARTGSSATGSIVGRLVIALSLFSPAGLLCADTIRLSQGGTVEGQILERTDEGVRIRTLVGVMVVPHDAIDRIDEAPSVFDEYETRRKAAPNTAAAHVELARWCDQKGLKAEKKTHFQRAMELDPDCEPARAALGFVRINGLWVDGKPDKSPDGRKIARTQPVKAESQPAPTDSDEKLVAAAQSRWYQRIRALRVWVTDTIGDKASDDAKRKLLEITDPLAIVPLARVLSEGDAASRELLVEALSRFPQDEATLNLAVLALSDPLDHVRTLALSKLAQRDDPRVVPQFRKALQSDNDELIRRAANALGALKAKPAIPELIELLTARRLKSVQVSLRPMVYFNQFVQSFDTQYSVHMGGGNVTYTPAVGVATSGVAMGFDPQMEVRQVTVFRTEVLEALKRITDVNFGFDDAAWRRWYEEQKP